MFSCRIDDSLELRPWDHRHAEELFAQVDRNRDHLRQWLPWVDATRAVDDTRAFIRRAIEQHARNEGFHVGIFEGARIVGGVGLVSLNWDHNRSEVGYWLSSDMQGRGIMTRACGRVVEHLFEIGVNRVEIRCGAANVRSRAVAERLKFTQEGVIRQVQRIRERYVDLAVYGMLAPEWRRFREEVRR
jgi:ribosomal-protein-serine acetyltransferase